MASKVLRALARESSETANLDHQEFLKKAVPVVDLGLGDIGSLLTRSSLGGGLWHPNGFAVFEVREVEQLGLLRLHVWPARLRRTRAGHPQIHNHSFRLYSRVVAGEYIETQYAVIDQEVAQPTDGRLVRLRKYVVERPVQVDRDVVVDSGVNVGVIAMKSGLRFPAGTSHELDAGKYHATRIPRHTLCATLALLSPRILESRDVLLGREGFMAGASIRPRVSTADLAVIQQQLLTSGLSLLHGTHL